MLNTLGKQHPIKVIQFGEGNFLRAFVDWMIHQMNEAGLFNGQVAVVQPLPTGLKPLLEDQNCHYTHFLKGMKEGQPYEEHYINQSIQKTVNPYTDFQDYLDLAKIDSAKIIVSNTTEAGIEFNDKDSMEDEANVTFPGKLTQLLYKRFLITKGAVDKGYILLPCELIDNNGDHLKEAVLAYAQLWSLPESFIYWLNEANTFCNTLVDRIVPGYPRETADTICKQLGYEDKLIVESELFNLWVIQGDDKIREAFPAKEIGCNVLVVDDVTPYKKRKVRILNGAHTSLVPVGYLYGKETVREAIEDPILEKYLNHVLFKEIIPTLTLPKEELKTFAGDVIERFQNPFIKHYLISIALNSISKYKTRVLPSLLTYAKENNSVPKGMTLALASLILFYRGTFNDMAIPLNDTPENIEYFNRLWSIYDDHSDGIDGLEQLVNTVLANTAFWDHDLNTVDGLAELVVSYMNAIMKDGMAKTLDRMFTEVAI